MTDWAKYPRVSVPPKDGSEPFHTKGLPLQQPLMTVRDFWSWACSDLIGNTLRGQLAEFFVARAVESELRVRVEWDAYDVSSPQGIRIEVKASGYLQSWHQERLSAISFDISPTRAWSANTNTYALTAARAADVYAFALHHHQDKSTVDPLDLSQWTFYVLSTAVLDDKCGAQRTLGLGSLERLGAQQVQFADLGRAIMSVAPVPTKGSNR